MAEQDSKAVALRDRDPSAALGFGTQGAFEYTNRAAMALARSTLVPVAFRMWVPDKRQGAGKDDVVENPNAVANCIIALNMSARMGADPLMIMQNLYIVEGRPSWSAQFVIACINACGRFSPLRFDLSPPSETPTAVEYEVAQWERVDGKSQKKWKKVQVQVHNRTCRAWVIEKGTGERLDGPEISMAMAVAEGWYGKQGSKWQTMPEMMLRYRAAAFFGRLYAPELLMGLHTDDEVRDITDAQYDASPLIAGPIPAMPTRDQFRTDPDDAVDDGDGDGDASATGGETVDPETGEVTGGGELQLNLDPGGGAMGKAVNYFIPVPMRDGAGGKKIHDWLGWAEQVRGALKAFGSAAEVQAMREANKETMVSIFRADAALAQDLVGEISDREGELG